MQTDMDQTVYMQIDGAIAACAAPGHSVMNLSANVVTRNKWCHVDQSHGTVG